MTDRMTGYRRTLETPLVDKAMAICIAMSEDERNNFARLHNAVFNKGDPAHVGERSEREG